MSRGQNCLMLQLKSPVRIVQCGKIPQNLRYFDLGNGKVLQKDFFTTKRYFPDNCFL